VFDGDGGGGGVPHAQGYSQGTHREGTHRYGATETAAAACLTLCNDFTCFEDAHVGPPMAHTTIRLRDAKVGTLDYPREREREREIRERDTRERERESVCVCVCVCERERDTKTDRR
jgi:hypothetical protein